MNKTTTTQKDAVATEHESERSPVVVVVGHIDHGKSTLLDYIRKTAVVEDEVGGITQHISAYEVTHADDENRERSITFLDTPGHEAFSAMRSRGLEVADIAILVVSVEDGVMPQTLESFSLIREYKLPFVVALTKIDKTSANIDKAKASLIEHEIYLEGMGGDVPFVPVSSKTGEGINALLGMIILVADIAELKGKKNIPAEGVVIEAHRDPKRGISATLIIKNGTLKSGMFVVSNESIAPTRIVENFLGKPVREASFSSPITVVGFSSVPEVGAKFIVVDTKKEAETLAQQKNISKSPPSPTENTDEPTENDKSVKHYIPIVIKADVLGTIDAIKHELKKIDTGNTELRITNTDVGAITENDIQALIGSTNPIVVGFNVEADASARELARRHNIPIETFDIIYKLTEWIEEAIKERSPKISTEEIIGKAKVLKTFSKTRNKQVIGGRVEVGVLKVKDKVRIVNDEEVVGTGTITSLQSSRQEVKQVETEKEFGAQIETSVNISEKDYIESVKIAEK
jgi:translation initiation factor IF-2